jgi:hypothetical protein
LLTLRLKNIPRSMSRAPPTHSVAPSTYTECGLEIEARLGVVGLPPRAPLKTPARWSRPQPESAESRALCPKGLLQMEWQLRQLPCWQCWQCRVQQPASPEMKPLPSAGVKPALTCALLNTICAAVTRAAQSEGGSGGGVGGGGGGSGPVHCLQSRPQPPW